MITASPSKIGILKKMTDQCHLQSAKSEGVPCAMGYTEAVQHQATQRNVSHAAI